jgi:hypothetical protein
MSDRPNFLLFTTDQELAPTWKGEPGFEPATPFYGVDHPAL